MIKICKTCGYVGKEIRKIRGNGLLEVLFWLFLVFPGFLYSLWRRGGQRSACPKCGHDGMIPLDTPAGDRLIQEYEIDITKISKKHSFKTLSIVLSIFGLFLVIGFIGNLISPQESNPTQRPLAYPKDWQKMTDGFDIYHSYKDQDNNMIGYINLRKMNEKIPPSKRPSIYDIKKNLIKTYNVNFIKTNGIEVGHKVFKPTKHQNYTQDSYYLYNEGKMLQILCYFNLYTDENARQCKVFADSVINNYYALN